MPFSASAIFCFTSSTWSKCFPWGLFSIWGNKTESLSRDLVHRDSGVHRSCHFLVKNRWTQHGVGRCTTKSPIVKWTNALKEFSKNIHWGQGQLNNASGYTDTDGFLEHSPSGRSLHYKGLALQKVILFVLGPPCIYKYY